MRRYFQVMFLLPVGGIVDRRFGIMTTPGHKGIPMGIVAGMRWAADNQAYTQGFDPDIFFEWLQALRFYLVNCLFVPVPDKVGNAKETLNLFWRWWGRLHWWPLAFAAQDGQENLDFPPSAMWSTLFVGGTTEWKTSRAAVECIERARALGKNIHIGRVNWHKRYQFFANLEGSEHFTCDGTRTRFDGTRRAVKEWANYMEQDKLQMRLPLEMKL